MDGTSLDLDSPNKDLWGRFDMKRTQFTQVVCQKSFTDQLA